MELGWKLLRFSNAATEFSPFHTFFNGQCFNWVQVDTIFVSVFRNSLLEVKSDSKGLMYRLSPEWEEGGDSEAIRDYLQLDVSMNDLFQQWVSLDPSLTPAAESKQGMRILRQDPWECTISFLCSQNNNIKRITKLLLDLRAHYGQHLIHKHDRDWYAFPTPADLSAASVSDLKNIGLGYRAEYVFKTCRSIVDKGGVDWLLSLRGDPNAAKSLQELDGIGPKVADCIALFALDGKARVPIDVHMWRIAKEKFRKELKGSATLTEPVYEKIRTLFREKYGEYAGWAHS